jgi:hypothetical protein
MGMTVLLGFIRGRSSCPSRARHRSNAAVAQFGATVQSGLETAAPYLKGTGYFLGALSVGNGFRTGGLTGAAYSAADVALETALSSSLAGVAAAVAFDRLGGSRAFASAARQSMAITFCTGQGGL